MVYLLMWRWREFEVGRDSRLQDPREEGETRSNEQDVRRERQYLETQDTSEEL